MAVVAALVGGGFAATAHAAKATTRAALNTSPEPFTNVGASLLEDGMVPAGLWLAVMHPLVFALMFAAVLALSVWLIARSWRFRRAHLQRPARPGRGARLPTFQAQPSRRPMTCSRRS